jgi:phage terminase large subunit
MPTVSLKKIIAPSFYPVYGEFFDTDKSDFWLMGGRGSTKSTFASICVVLDIMRNASRGEVTNALVLRKVANTLRQSVFAQVQKAIDLLQVNHLWKPGLSPLQLTYKPNGAIILFDGCDDATKLKSITVPKGYIRTLWIEEVAEFSGIEEIRSVRQSVLRGGDSFKVIQSFNPPRSKAHWTNAEVLIPTPDRVVHKSCYLDVDPAWLGPQFLRDAEQLRLVNEEAFRHEYLGESVGTGGQIFRNMIVKPITSREILDFGYSSCGLDFGFAIDPCAISWLNYSRKTKTLWIFDEEYQYGCSNSKTAELIRKREWRKSVICDSAEPKSIADLSSYGIRAMPARKGKGSIERGMRFLTNEITQIIIDPSRTPNAVREFSSYEYLPNPNGGWRNEYPDSNNHLIDATRYGLQDFMQTARIR